MSIPTGKDVMFYVTAYTDHLNHILPEKGVIKPKYSYPDRFSSYPFFLLSDVREGKISGVKKVDPPSELQGWEYWMCEWNDAHFDEMNIVPEFVADEDYIDQWPDAWFMENLFANSKAKEAFEKHTSNACFFVPIKVFSRQTGEPIDVERWMVAMRHWLYLNGDYEDSPNTDFLRSSHPKHIFRALQSDLEAIRFLQGLGVFSGPTKYSRPTYSPDLFKALQAEGLSGLKEKSPNKSRLAHKFREVIGHAYA